MSGRMSSCSVIGSSARVVSGEDRVLSNEETKSDSLREIYERWCSTRGAGLAAASLLVSLELNGFALPGRGENSRTSIIPLTPELSSMVCLML